MNRISSLLLALALLLACPTLGHAGATVLEYGHLDARFTLEIPDNWPASPIPDGAIVTAPSTQTHVTIISATVAAVTPEQFVTEAAALAGLEPLVEYQPGLWTGSGKIDDVPVSCAVGNDGTRLVTIVVRGYLFPEIRSLIASLTLR